MLLFTMILTANSPAQPSFSFYFTTAFPINDYRLLDSEEGYGGSLEAFFLTPSKEHPLGMGISFSYFGQGLQFYDDPFTDETYLSNNRANNFGSMHLVFQLAPTGGTVRPYMETFFGGSYVYSETEIITVDNYPADLYVDDWAWSYGAGAGIKFLISKDENRSSIYIDLKGRYLMSSNVELIDRRSIRYANDAFYYSMNETQLNFISVQLGLLISF